MGILTKKSASLLVMTKHATVATSRTDTTPHQNGFVKSDLFLIVNSEWPLRSTRAVTNQWRPAKNPWRRSWRAVGPRAPGPTDFTRRSLIEGSGRIVRDELAWKGEYRNVAG